LGIDAILAKTMDLLEKTPVFPLKGMGQEGGMKIYDAHKNAPERAYEIREERKGYWRISGQQVEATYALINVSTDEGIQKLIRFLDKIGVDDRLHDSGAKNGDTVAIGDFEFEYTQ
jgi:GTP-binding protein